MNKIRQERRCAKENDSNILGTILFVAKRLFFISNLKMAGDLSCPF